MHARRAAIVDLRRAFVGMERAGAPAEEEGEQNTEPASPPPPADDGNEGAGEDEVQNPRIKQLSDEAARHRTTAKAEKERADAAEAKTTDLEAALHEARMFNAFILAAVGKVADVDAAWKLADKVGATLAEDGAVSGMEDVVAATLRKYPYLSPKPAEDLPEGLGDKFPALQPSGRQTNAKRQDGALNRSALASKFPALRRR
jgi:hypothetical protein